MLCAKCSNDNPSDASFCERCGAKLELVCPTCKTLASPGARFCKKCGTGLATRPDSHPVGPSEPPIRVTADAGTAPEAIEGERKTVTALFADIKGSTELMRELDPEEARAIVDPVLQLMITAVHRYDGYVAQSTGDGIFAMFGAPVAHEDHPQRALHAALAIQDELRRYGDTTKAAGEQALEARIGINTGEVVLRMVNTGGRTEYSPVGHAANLAARLQTVAPPGGTVISEETSKLVASYFQLRELGSLTLKGITERVKVYEVMSARPLHGHFEVATRRGLTKFVGREHELTQLKRALEQASVGRGQLVAIVAEAGTGKSRLVYDFKAILPSGCKLIEAYSVSHGKAAWRPVLELLRVYFGIESVDEAPTRRTKVRTTLAALDSALNDGLPYLFGLLGIQEAPDPLAQMDSQIKRQRTADAIKRIIFRESLVQPTVVIFEDLHWIDSETQALLDVVADSIANARVLLLVNYRPEYRHEWASRGHYVQLRLDPLADESAGAMLSELLGDDEELATVKRVIAERTGGNPFFIEEMVQALFEQNILARNGDVKLVRPLSAAHLPVTVQGILASRIDRLPAAEKELLQTLAVIGRKQSLALIRKVASAKQVDVERLLAELRTGEFIYEEPALSDVDYRFKHALTQEVAYNSVLAERRKASHERIADAIGQLFGDKTDEHLAEMAYHYARSANAGMAIRHLHLAAQRAALRSANYEAVEEFGTALQILQGMPSAPERDQQELDLLIGLGPVLMALKGFGAPECEEVYRRARDLCLRIGETPILYTVLWGRWMSHSVQAKWESAVPLANELMAIAKNVSDPTLVLEAHHAGWNTFICTGDLPRAAFHVKEGVALYDPSQHQMLVSRYGGHDPGVCAYSHGSINLWLLGNPNQSKDLIRKALNLALRLGHHQSYARAEDAAAWAYLLRREPQSVLEHAKMAIRVCQEFGFVYWGAHAQMLLGWALCEQGQDEDGIQLIRKGLEDQRKTGAFEHRGYFLLHLAERLSRSGRLDLGLAALWESAELLSNGERFHEAELLRVTAEMLLMQNRAEEEAAEAKLREAIKLSIEQSAKAWELRATTSLARLLTQHGRRNEARSMLAEIYNWFTEGFDTADLKDAKALLDEPSG